MTYPDEYNIHDAYYERAMHDLYGELPQGPGLNAIEQAGLLPVCARYWRRPLADRDTAAIPELREDGAAVLVKLTVERLDRYAAAYYEREAWTAQQFSFPADA